MKSKILQRSKKKVIKGALLKMLKHNQIPPLCNYFNTDVQLACTRVIFNADVALYTGDLSVLSRLLHDAAKLGQG